MSTKQIPAAGDIITAVPVGQTRRQTIEVTHVTELDGTHFVHGLLVSKKWPGDYRGTAIVMIEADR